MTMHLVTIFATVVQKFSYSWMSLPGLVVSPDWYLNDMITRILLCQGCNMASLHGKQELGRS